MTTGAVLCGGASRRMGPGRDKALLEVGGVASGRRVATALVAGGCAEVLLVGGDEKRLAALELPWLADRWPGEGPLGGILTALEHTGDTVVVAACDLALLEGRTVAAVRAPRHRRGGPDVVVAVAGGHHVLLARWRPSALAPARLAFHAGVRSLSDVYATAGLAVATVEVPPRVALDVNTPEDLRTAGDRAKERTDG